MIRQLLENARQRLLYNQLAAQFTLAVSLVLGALILLLLAGTQVLDWRILAVLIVCGAAFGLIRTLRRLPSLYQIAVLIDRRAHLFDTLSTAWIFELGQGASQAPAEIAAGQRLQAETMARAVDLETALPFTMPRAVYAMAALFLIATSLFALRYGISRSLDLKPPITSMVMDALGWNPPASAEKKKSKADNPMTALLKQLGISMPEQGEKTQPANLDPATDSALETVGDPDSDNSLAKNPPGSKSEEASLDGKAGDPSTDPEDSNPGDQATPGKGNPQDSMGSNEGPQQGEQQASKSGSAGENSSLLSKIKDALNNMMAKSKSQQASGGQKSQSQSAQSQSGAQSNDKGQPGQGKQEGGKEQADASQDGQQQGDSEASQNSPGKGGGKSSDRDTSAQPGSGIGRQDGAKDVRAAQQEKAMGKLSEVIGKRSANVTGEMTVEVQSGSQQLKTAYSQKSAQHTANGGDLSRDEVPLDLQPFVSGYFDEIRKQPAAAAKPAGK
ncbi:MAG TPA: hypothetical protein VGL72_05750 [Bryobacteraceae bacterium]